MRKENKISDSIFKVYQGHYLSCFGIPTVIVCADQVVKTTLYSEYFVFIEGENTLFWGGKISIETNGAPEHIIKADIPTLIEEALLQAKTTISLRQKELLKKKNIDLWIRDQIELKEKDKLLIARLWMSGKFKDQLRNIKDKTTCKPLHAYISLLDGVKFYNYDEFE